MEVVATVMALLLPIPAAVPGQRLPASTLLVPKSLVHGEGRERVRCWRPCGGGAGPADGRFTEEGPMSHSQASPTCQGAMSTSSVAKPLRKTTRAG